MDLFSTPSAPALRPHPAALTARQQSRNTVVEVRAPKAGDSVTYKDLARQGYHGTLIEFAKFPAGDCKVQWHRPITCATAEYVCDLMKREA